MARPPGADNHRWSWVIWPFFKKLSIWLIMGRHWKLHSEGSNSSKVTNVGALGHLSKVFWCAGCFPHASRSIGGQTISGINSRSQIIHFSLRDPDRMCSLRCIQSATISLDCPYLGLLGSYITNSYVPMGFQMFVGGFGAQKWFKNGGLSKNTIFKPKSLHKTLGFGRCLWADLNGNFFHIFLQIPY